MSEIKITANNQEVFGPMPEFWIDARSPSLAAYTLNLQGQYGIYSILNILVSRSELKHFYLWQFNLN